MGTLRNLFNKFMDMEIPGTKKISPEEKASSTIKNFSDDNQKRMEASGLKLYVWSTCGDERVCDECKIMDEKLCRWESSFVYSDDGGESWKRRPKGAV